MCRTAAVFLAVFTFLLSLLLPATAAAQGSFRRGNANGDARVDIADVIFTLNYLFRRGLQPPCVDAADANDDGDVDLSDGVYLLFYLFLNRPPPPAPGPVVEGPDPTPDTLPCGPGLPPGYELVLTLDAGFPADRITGAEIIFDTAPGGPPLDLLAPLQGGGAGVEIISEVRDLDRDPDPELVFAITPSPFAGGAATLFLPSPPLPMAIAAIRVHVLSREGVLAAALATHLPSGEPIVLAPDRGSEISFALACGGSLCLPAGGANRPPVIAGGGSHTVAPGRKLEVTVAATDPDGDDVTFTFDNADLAALPGEHTLSVSVATATVALTPLPQAERGEPYPIRWEARDDFGAATFSSLQITVRGGNSPPIWDPVPTQLAAEGVTLDVPLGVHDPDGDALTLTLDAGGLPPGNDAALDTTSRRFSWTPTFADASASPYNVRVRAQDAGGALATLAFAVVVVEARRPPVVTAPASVRWRAGVRNEFRFDLSDPEGDPADVTLDLSTSFPPGAVALDPELRSVTSTAALTQARAEPYDVRIIARDPGGATGAADVKVFVLDNNANSSPVFTVLPPQRAVEGRVIAFTILVSDPESDPVTVELDASLLPQPNDAELVGRTFTWTPGLHDARDTPYRARFRATDARGAATEASVLIEVGEAGSDPGPPSRLVVLLPGETLDPSSSNGRSGTPGTQTAGLPFAVRVVQTDAFFNVVPGAAARPGLAVADTGDANAASVPIPPAEPQGSADQVVAFTNLLASPGHRLTVQGDPGGLVTEPSSVYAVFPGATAEIAVVLPGQTLRPGVLEAGGAVSGDAFGGVGVVTSTAFVVQVVAVDSHGNWNFQHGSRPGEAQEVMVTTDAVFAPAGAAIAATNAPQAGRNVAITGPFTGPGFRAGAVVRVQDAGGREHAEVAAVAPGTSITVASLERSYTRPQVTLVAAGAGDILSVGQRFGTLTSGLGAVTGTAAVVDPLFVRLDNALDATIDLGGRGSGDEIAAAIQAQVRAAAVADAQRWRFTASFEGGRYLLRSGVPARAVDPARTVAAAPGDTAADLKLLPPEAAAFPGEFLDAQEVAAGFPAGTEKLRFSRGVAFFEVMHEGSQDPQVLHGIAAFTDPQQGLGSVALSGRVGVTTTTAVLVRAEARDADANGAIETLRLVADRPVDASALDPGLLSVVFRPGGAPAAQTVAVSRLDPDPTSTLAFLATLEQPLGTTTTTPMTFRTAVASSPAPALADVSLHYGPTARGPDATVRGRAFLVDRAPPVLLGTATVDTNGDGAPDLLELVFSEEIQFRAGRAAAVGNVIDDGAGLTVAAGDTFQLRLDDTESLFTFPEAATGATGVAARLDDFVTNVTFTAATVSFAGSPAGPGRFVIQGGEGAGRTVSVTGGTAAAALGFDGTHIEVPGSDDASPDLGDFLVIGPDGRSLLDVNGTLTVEGATIHIPLTGARVGEEIQFALRDDLEGSAIADGAGNDLVLATNIPDLVNAPGSSGFIRIRDSDASPGDGVLSAPPGVVRLDASPSLLAPGDIASVRFDILSLERATTVRFFSPAAIPAQGPADDIFPNLMITDPIEVFEMIAAGDVGRFRFTVTLTPQALARRNLFANSQGQISREFTLSIRDVPPVADAGPDVQVAVVGAPFLLDARGSRDPNGEALEPATWTVSSPAGDTQVLGGDTVAFTPALAGAHAITLRVHDRRASHVAEKSVTLVATGADPSRFVPTADAGVELVVRTGSLARLDGRNSRLPLGDFTGLRFLWTQVSGPTAVLGGAQTAMPEFTPAVPGVYAFELRVTDSQGLRPGAADRVTVTVVDDAAPQPRFVPEARAALLEPPAGAVAQTFDRFVIAGAGSVDDGVIQKFDWRQVGGVTVPFVADADQLSFRPVLSDTYTFELVVTDNTGLASLPRRVSIPVVPAGASPPLAIAENDIDTGMAAVTLSSAASPGTIRWTQTDGPWVALTGAGTTSPSFTAPGSGVYVFQLEVTDANGVTATDLVQVNVSLPARPLPRASLQVVPLMDRILLRDAGSSPAGVELSFFQTDGLRNVLVPTTPTGDEVSFTPPIDAPAGFGLRVYDPSVDIATVTTTTALVTTDRVPPAAAMSLGTFPPSGSNDLTPDITGSGEPGATVEVFASADCSGALAGAGMVAADGTFTVTVTATAGATSTFTVRLVDQAGNSSSCSQAVTYFHDGTPPLEPVIIGTVPSPPSSERSPIVAGMAEAGATVEVFLDFGCGGAAAASVTADSGGVFAAQVTVPADATTAITVRAVDAAGNISTCSSAFLYVHQTQVFHLDFTQEPADVAVNETFTVTVAARDQFQNPVTSFAGEVTVALGQGPPGASLAGTTTRTAQAGVAVFDDLALDTTGTFTLVASAAGFQDGETAPFTVRIGNTPPEITSLVVSGSSGAIEIRYRLADSQSDRADVLVEFSRDAASPFEIATQAGGGSSGVFGLLTASPPLGIRHTFLWNASRDLGPVSATDVRVRVTPFQARDGIAGASVIQENVTISQELALAPIPSLTAPGAADVVAAPINGDGYPDLAAVSPGENSVTVYFRDPINPTFFSSTAVVATGPEPTAVQVIDFNRDGKPDLVVSLRAVDAVEVFAGDGLGTFTSIATGTTGDAPVAVAVGDLNGDGLPDIVTADGGGATVSVFLQDRGGALDPGVPYRVGIGPTGIALADFNRDGRADLVVANGGGNTVTVFLQSPTAPGTFLVPALEVTVGTSPSSVATGDLNRDGRSDLAVANAGSDSVTVVLGNGDGTFEEGLDVDTGPGSMPKDVAIADLDQDFFLDLAVAGGNGDLRLQLQTVTSTGVAFRDSSSSAFNPVGQRLTAVVAADFTGDGHTDVVVADADGNAVRPQQNNTPLDPDPQLSLGRSFPGGGGDSVDVADFNRDGHLDVLSATATAATVRLGRGNGELGVRFTYLEPDIVQGVALDANGDDIPDFAAVTASTVVLRIGQGDGGFPSAVVSPATSGARAAAVGDFDRDGHPDLVIAGDDLVILAGNGAGGFANVTTTATVLDSVAAGELTFDDNLDVAGASSANAAVLVFAGDGAGNLALSATIPTGIDPGTVRLDDFNVDGRNDIAVASRGDRTVSVFLPGPGGGFAPAAGSPFAVGGIPSALATGDADGDHDLDVAVALSDVNQVWLLVNDGAGGLSDSGARVPTPATPVSLAVTTLDADLFLDLVVGSHVTDSVATVRGRDMARFFDGPDLGTGTNPVETVIGDFNRDGKLDTVVFNRNSTLVRVLLGDDRGGFPQERTFPLQLPAGAAATADTSGDAILDLIVGPVAGPGFVFRGLGDGNFALSSSFGAPRFEGVVDIAVGDVNRDGRADIATASPTTDTVHVFFGSGTGTFSVASLLTTGAMPGGVVLADFTGDGILDVGTANTGSSTATVHAGLGNGQFIQVATVPTQPQPTGIAAGNSNRDGHVDIAVAHSGGITFFPGASPAGTFGQAIDLETVTTTASVVFSGPDIVGFSGNTITVHEHSSGDFFNPPEVHIGPAVIGEGDPEADDTVAIRDVLLSGGGGLGGGGGGGCFIGRFDYVGGTAAQRAATLITILTPFAVLAALRGIERWRRRRRWPEPDPDR